MEKYTDQAISECNPALRSISAALSLLGGMMMLVLMLHRVEAIVPSWSPTKTARDCFHFPDEPESINKSKIRQFLLSAAFFGNDAFYFDYGEENTGSDSFSGVALPDISGEETPDDPLGGLDEPEQNTNIYNYDYSSLPEGVTAIVPYDLSSGASGGAVLLSNTTSYEPDIAAALTAKYPIDTRLSDYSADEPLILILHTHGTESYAEDGALYCEPTALHRNTDITQNVVAVGSVMAGLLNDAGIPTIHCEVMHDLNSYTNSYNLAADTIQKYLQKYPSIKYVFDVHRDAIVRANGDMIRPITAINGEPTAQIMLLVGTNEKGADHPKWETNFTVATQLQSRLTDRYSRFARPINIRGASFNEQFTPGSLLIEIGSAANSLEEAKAAAKYLTYSIIDMIKENAD